MNDNETVSTPDYITPEAPPFPVNVGCNKLEELSCPKSPEKLKSVRSKRQRESFLKLGDDVPEENEMDSKAPAEPQPQTNKQGYVSQSVVELRCRVMPHLCMKNPYIKDASENDVDPFGDRRSKCAVFLPAAFGGDGLSRYRTDFHEVEQIGTSHVFKVLKIIDGCMYAVKRSSKKLHHDTDRQKASDVSLEVVKELPILQEKEQSRSRLGNGILFSPGNGGRNYRFSRGACGRSRSNDAFNELHRFSTLYILDYL